MNTTPIEYEIEFLVWDGKKVIIPEIGDWLFIGSSSFISLNNEREDIICDNLEGVCKPMQRTALRSINDKPIYNHMIVKNEFGDHFLVDMFNYPIMEFLTRFDLKIVGNRFQHPELLEMCK